MKKLPTIQVQAPKFELYESVVLYWNEREQVTQIVRRWLNLDDGGWWYKIQSSEQLYPENAFSPHLVNSPVVK